MNLPSSWGRMSAYQKLCYLVDTHQAKDFKEAGKILSPKREKRVDKPIIVRNPYRDD